MEFVDIYLLIENRDYDKFQSVYRDHKHKLTEYQRYFLESGYLIKMGQFDNARKLLTNYLSEDTTLSQEQKIPLLVKLQSFIHLIGQVERAKLLNKEISSYYQQKNPTKLFELMIFSEFNNNCGSFYTLQCDYDKSEEFFEKAIEIETKLSFPIRIAKIKSNYAVSKMYNGQLTSSLSLLFEAKQIRERDDDLHGLALTYGNISEIFELKGDYELSLDYNKRAQVILEKFGNSEEIAMNLFNQAKILSKMSNFSTANQVFKKTLQIRSQNIESSFPNHHAQTLTSYLIFLIMNNKPFNHIYFEISELRKRYPNSQMIELSHKFVDGIIKFYSEQLNEKIEAREIFEKLLEESSNYFQLYNELFHFFIDTLLLEYRVTRSLAILEKLEIYCKEIDDMGFSKNSIELMIKGKILEFQLLIYRNKRKEAFIVINELIEFTYEKGLPHLFRIVKYLYQQFQMLISSVKIDISEIDLLVSISKLLNIDDRSEQDHLEVKSIFLLTDIYEIDQIYGSFPKNIDLKDYMGFINLSTTQFVRFYDRFTFLILKKEIPWIGVLFTGNLNNMILLLNCLNDFLKMRYSLTQISGDKLEYFKTEEVNKIIETFVETDFDALGENFKLSISEDYIPDTEDLMKYDIFLHPIRLSIMYILAKNFKMLRTELWGVVGGKKSTFTLNLNKLLDQNYLRSETHFVDEGQRKLLFITHRGLDEFLNFKNIFEAGITPIS